MPFRRVLLACLVSVAAIAASLAHANQVVVRSGDSLWSIARAHDTTVAELMAANGLSSERLSLGQVLQLPVDTPSIEYTVVPNDTLYDIARRFGVSVASLQAANALTGAAIRPGHVLTIPGGVDSNASTAAAPAPAAAPGDAPAAVADQVAPADNRAGESDGPSADVVVASEPESDAAASVETAPNEIAAAHYTVQPADTLYDIARAVGVSVDDLIAWNSLDGTLIRPGQQLALQPDPTAPSQQPLVVTVRSGDNLWTLARLHDTTVASIASANGLDPQATLRLGQTLTIPGRYASVASADGSAPSVGGAAATQITVGPGDSLWTIAQRHGTTVGALMELNALRSDRLQVGQSLRILPGGAPTQALPAAAAPQAAVPSTGMVWPLVGQITSRFGYRRLRIGGTNMHYGLDIDGNVGDPIRSATAGTVTFSGWRGGFGNLVIVTNGDTEYFYAHASELIARAGQTVAPGDLIARVGATGNVTGPHLHFEIRVNGTPVDPLPILEARATR